MALKSLAKRVVNSVAGVFGLEVRKRKAALEDSTRIARASLLGSLEHVKALGFAPATVVDVGAAHGTDALYDTFPDARHVLIECLEENRPDLERIARKYRRVEFVIAAASSKPGTVTIHVHPDLVGTSRFLEHEDSDVNGVPREVPAITLDDLCAERALPGPYLLKFDVQGAELEVLEGASRALRETEYAVLEVSLFRFFDGGPQLWDVVSFMKARGFVVYDVLDGHYRPLDGAMAQVDLAFVNEAGRFRGHHHYGTREQRAEQNARFARRP